ncbi:MAG: putative deoxyribonuclease YcfH, partial [Planctomycetota bacterium]
MRAAAWGRAFAVPAVRADTLRPVLDTHCHLTFPDYEGRVAEVLAAAREAGVTGAITVSTTTADAARTVALAERHDGLWATAGVHPLYADEPCD